MATALVDLDNRIVTDEGEVVAKYELLEEFAMRGEPLFRHKALDHPDVRFYNARNGNRPDKAIPIWHPGSPSAPPNETYAWAIPPDYVALDVFARVFADAERRLGTNPPEEYLNRLADELDMMSERGMLDFLRCLIYVLDTLRDRGVVHGVGRGSSCASLVLYVIGVHRVDPVAHDIPVTEFLK